MKSHSQNPRDGSAGKSACCEAQWPEFSPQDSHGENRQPTFISCPLSCRHTKVAKKKPHLQIGL